MALSTDKKLIISVVILGALGGALVMQNKKKAAEDAAHSSSASQAALPELGLTSEALATATKVSVTTPAEPASEGKAEKPATTWVLEKQGDDWRVTAPVNYPANQSNIENLLKNLEKLSLVEKIADSEESWAGYDLNDQKSLAVQVWAGDQELTNLHLGKSGGRGQTVRVGTDPATYSLKGYSSYLYERDGKGWRDTAILELDAPQVVSIDVSNAAGEYDFTKEGESWKAQFKKAKGFQGSSWKAFDSSKVDDLLRAFQSLQAQDFGDNVSREAAGLVEPSATVTFTLSDDTKQVLQLGGVSDGQARYLVHEGNDQVFTIGSWAANWAVAEPEKFEKAEE
ncbi:MAG: DUF4340 domain-containing protein [Polyangiaceae bacterium]|nr:DUF4340 domain-containing protein [Polyangiaceae bacterium]